MRFLKTNKGLLVLTVAIGLLKNDLPSQTHFRKPASMELDSFTQPTDTLFFSDHKVLFKEMMLEEAGLVLDLGPVLHNFVFSKTPHFEAPFIWGNVFWDFTGPSFQIGIPESPFKLTFHKALGSDSSDSLNFEIHQNTKAADHRSVFFVQLKNRNLNETQRAKSSPYYYSQRALFSDILTSRSPASSNSYNRPDYSIQFGFEALFY
jgi:hypothetical protein